MKCKKCKEEMEEVDSGFDLKGDMNIDFQCLPCRLYLEATWFCEKPQKSTWLSKKQYDKIYL